MGLNYYFVQASTSDVDMYHCMVSASILFHSGGPVSTGGRFEHIGCVCHCAHGRLGLYRSLAHFPGVQLCFDCLLQSGTHGPPQQSVHL